MADLHSKSVLVTGGASGIGSEIARRFAAAGAQLTLVDLNADGAKLADDLGARFVAADVGDPGAWEKIAAECDHLDIACLNAGITGGVRSIEALTDDRYRRVVSTNVDGVVFGVRALSLPMSRRGGGSIVVTASLAGIVAMDDDPIYTLTKHAVVGFVRSVSGQLAEINIKINAVCPGITDTPLLSDEVKARFAKADFPLVSAADVAATVVELSQSPDSGQAWVCQPGREAMAFRFPNVPGPRAPGGAGRRPPSMADSA